MFLPCNIGFCSAKVESVPWQKIVTNTIAAVSVGYNVVVAHCCHLIDTESVLIPFGVHARELILRFSYTLGWQCKQAFLTSLNWRGVSFTVALLKDCYGRRGEKRWGSGGVASRNFVDHAL